MSALLKNIALVSQTSAVRIGEALKISAALQKQVERDFAPIWEVRATVDAFERIDDVPVGYWPILIRDDIGYDAAGIHLDQDGQPYALVQASNGTPLTCSHECLEMLADPFGNRFVASDSLIQDQGRVQYLLEVCDPSEADAYGYQVNGLRLSDFYTPNYFDPVANPAVRYSFTNSIRSPRQVLKDGYISWHIPEKDEWWQATYFGAAISYRGPLHLQRQGGQSWREVIDRHTPESTPLIAGGLLPAQPAQPMLFAAASVRTTSHGWARRFQAEVERVIEAAQH